jgi:large subunit ribosomal protein L22
MPVATARARHLRVSPRKLRLVADLIRGKKVAEARDILQFTVKGGSPMLSKVLDSAVANAESKAAERRERLDTDEMVVSKVVVNDGLTMKRFRPAARSRAVRIRKRMSHVELVISDK